MYNNADSYVYFVMLNGTQASYSFDTYIDKEGNVQYIPLRNDERGNVIKRRFKFTKARRMISVPASQEKVLRFLRGHPECDGSPNSFGAPPQFKELNEAKDAEIAISATANKTKALNLALGLSGKKLIDVAASCGYTNKPPEILQHLLLQFAENNPVDFIEVCNAPDTELKALIVKGLENGKITRRGFMLYWNETYLGNEVRGDYQGPIAKLMGDEKLREALEDDVNRDENKEKVEK